MPLPAINEPPLQTVDVDLDVEVLYDDAWVFGTLRMWRQYPPPLGWVGWVRYAAPDGNRIDNFPADQIRPNQTDYSRGRTGLPPG